MKTLAGIIETGRAAFARGDSETMAAAMLDARKLWLAGKISATANRAAQDAILALPAPGRIGGITGRVSRRSSRAVAGGR